MSLIDDFSVHMGHSELQLMNAFIFFNYKHRPITHYAKKVQLSTKPLILQQDMMVGEGFILAHGKGKEPAQYSVFVTGRSTVMLSTLLKQMYLF